jgi:hypothetical protein
MNGQWIGPYVSANPGTLVVDLDDMKQRYEGTVTAYNGIANLPAIFGEISLPKGVVEGSTQVALVPVHRDSGLLLNPQQAAELYPDAQIPRSADVKWKFGAGLLSFDWTTDIGIGGQGALHKTDLDAKSSVVAKEDVRTWNEFKEHVTTLEPHRFVFRGHEDSTWGLRSSFHRTGRASLFKFVTQDVPSLHRHLSGLTTHRFDMNNSQDYAAFLNLVQHHGYPTPVLDWTQSPFIAAYFAFRNFQKVRMSREHKVRILIFDGRTWNSSFQRALALLPGFIHLTLLEPLAINNPRVVPQQSISSVSNLDNLEEYIAQRGHDIGKTFLEAIDLPAHERQKAMQELGLMGINAGSLFPGLDGACQQLKERYFDV